MARTIFKILTDLENDMDNGRLDTSAAELLKRLVIYVEGGDYVRSESDKFIAAHFRLGAAGACGEWNKTHIDKRSVSYFRGEFSVMSKFLCSMFGGTPEEISDAFLIGNETLLSYLSDLLDALGTDDPKAAERFAYLYTLGLISAQPAHGQYEYDISECSEELKLLRTLDPDYLGKLVGSVDRDKLSFLVQALGRPLFRTEYVSADGRSRKYRLAYVDGARLKAEKAFRSARPYLSSSVGTSGNESFRDIELPGMILSRLKKYKEKYDTFPAEKRQAYEARSTDETRRAAEEFFDSLTIDKTMEKLKRLNPPDVFAELIRRGIFTSE